MNFNTLNAKQCDAFLAVTETGGFDLAAHRLCITASAVTLRIQTLERTLGHLLLIRERPCRVTQAGQALLHYLQHRRLLEQQLRQDLDRKSAASEFYQIHIASNAHSLATWLLPTLRDSLIAEKITLHFKIDDRSQTHQLLESGLVNACISTQENAMNGCIAHVIGAMHYRMVATPEFAAQWFKSTIDREQLRLAPAIIYNTEDQLHHHVMLKYFGLNQQSYPQHHIPSSSAFAEAIFQGLGFGLLPEYQIGARLANTELIEILPQCQTKMMLYWHHWKQQSNALDVLTQVLIHHAQQQMNHKQVP